MDNPHLGSSFDDFLKEEGILEEVEVTAVKRVLAMELADYMSEQNITKVEMARRMGTSRAALDRLLNPENPSVTLQTMARAARSIGKHLSLTIR